MEKPDKEEAMPVASSDSQSEKIPSKNVPSENVPLENVPSENIPSENIPSENVPLEDVSSESIPDQSEKISLEIGNDDHTSNDDKNIQTNEDMCACPKQEYECNDTIGYELCYICKDSGESTCNCPKVEYVSPLDTETAKSEDNSNVAKICYGEGFGSKDKQRGAENPPCPKVESIPSCVPYRDSYGNDLAISAEGGLISTTCLNLEPDTPWDALDSSEHAPFSNGGVTINDFSIYDIIIENPVAEIDMECGQNDLCKHREHKNTEMRELSLETLGCQSNGQCKCCAATRNKNDKLGCPCRKTTRILIDENCGKSTVLVLHAEKDNQDCDQLDGSEIYANTLFIDMDDIGVLNQEIGPFLLPHDKTLALTESNDESEQLEIDNEPEIYDEPENVNKPEMNSNKHHTVYVCDEEDLEDVCRICHCGSEDEPLISPCLCTGSMQYIHHTCLMTWLQRTVRQNCELCQQEIPVVRKRKPITQWGLPNRRPTCFLWLFAFIVTLTLNIASITRDASQQCTTNACIVFYIVEAIGAILGFMFSCVFMVRSIRFIKLWMIHNEEWSFDSLTSIDNSKITKPQKPSKKRGHNIQI